MRKYQASFQMMGTFIELVIYHPNGEALIQAAYRELCQYSQRFTVNAESSELMSVNQSAGISSVVVERDLFELIKKAKAVSEDSQNPFNIAIGPLVKTWRIGFQDAKVPTQEQILEILPLIDPKKIMLNERDHSVYLSEYKMEIDLGAIAKGYFADEIKRLWLRSGVEHGFINLGGNVLTIGYSPTNQNKAWNVGIQNPLSNRGEIIRAVPLNDVSMVTSGINERFLYSNGQYYHHLLDPNAGVPISTDIASISIIARLSINAEIWSTAGFLPLATDAISYLNKVSGVEAVIVTKEGTVLVTQGLVDNGECILHLHCDKKE